jgi:hypothetical protein
MKKITLSLSILALMLISFSSCQKDEETKPVTPIETPIITLDELYGTWNFKSLKVDGITYSTCEELSDAGISGWGYDFKYYLFDDGENKTKYCDYNNHYNPQTIPSVQEFSLNIATNVITWIDNNITFKIKSYDKTSKIIVMQISIPNLTFNGIYMLNKQ